MQSFCSPATAGTESTETYASEQLHKEDNCDIRKRMYY